MLPPFDVEKIKAGDTASFKTFFTFYYPKLVAFAGRFVEQQRAKDLVQDVFAKFWEQRESLQVANFQSYLYKSVQNQCLNFLRHQSMAQAHEARLQIAEARAAHADAHLHRNDTWKRMMARDIRQSIELSLNKLPPRCAEAFRLCYFHDLPHKKAAEIMGISLRTVETHIRQAVCFLREDLRLYIPALLEVYKN